MAAPGATGGAEVIGLNEFRRALRQMGPEWPKELRKAHKEIATKGAQASQAAAVGMGGVERKAATAIKGRANQREARVTIVPGVRTRMANVAFWGAKKHTGWYRAGRYSGSRPQHPAWVGNTWMPLVAGQGPYAINNALAARKEQLLDEYFEMIDRIAHDAFPER